MPQGGENGGRCAVSAKIMGHESPRRPWSLQLKKMILRARYVVTMDGPPIENGAVAIHGNRIIDVGTFDEIRARASDEVVDLGERALLPGLINAHCHLDYTGLRGKSHRRNPSPIGFTRSTRRRQNFLSQIISRRLRRALPKRKSLERRRSQPWKRFRI